MASSAPSLISTNPNPRLRPVSRSVMTCALVTVPYWPNSSRRSSEVVVKARLPTYNFLPKRSPSSAASGRARRTNDHRRRGAGGADARPGRGTYSTRGPAAALVERSRVRCRRRTRNSGTKTEQARSGSCDRRRTGQTCTAFLVYRLAAPAAPPNSIPSIPVADHRCDVLTSGSPGLWKFAPHRKDPRISLDSSLSADLRRRLAYTLVLRRPP